MTDLDLKNSEYIHNIITVSEEPINPECKKNSEYIHNIIPFSLYRKFLKSSEMVYNELEIKNDMTKERMCWIRHDVVYEVFFVVNF